MDCVSYAITGSAKRSDTLLVSEFSTLVFLLDALFAIIVYLHIVFIKCLISEPSVISIQMDSPAGWCTIAHTLRTTR